MDRLRRTVAFLRLLHRRQIHRQQRVRQTFGRIFRLLLPGAEWGRRPLLGLTAISVVTPSSSPHPPPEHPSRKAKAFDWDAARIPDSLMENHRGDIGYIYMLREKTLECASCGRRHVVDEKVAGVEYCGCKSAKSSVYGEQTPGIEWTPFLERKDILVWRQEHPAGSGMYAYKMYGHFGDVTPNEFVEVQMDMSAYRLEWDQNTAQCHVIEQEGTCGRAISQIYYWEVNWPRFFSNRDYVCNRRALAFEGGDSDDPVVVVYSKSTTHPNAPKKSKNYRVEEYWSVMTIKPTKGWDEPGLEFSLTAFENPGLSLPQSITTWVAIRGMPGKFDQN